MQRHTFALIASGACVVLFAAAAQAGTVTFENMQVDEQGTGFGSVVNLLSVHWTGSSDSGYGTESGSVLWDGSGVNYSGTGSNRHVTDEVLSGDATNSSQLPAASAIASGGNVDIGLIYNINQTGSAGTTYTILHDFTVYFYNSDGSAFDSATYTAPLGGLTLDIDQQGTGGAGWLFRISGIGNFLSDGDRFIGMSISSGNAIEHVNDGAENFYVTSIPAEIVPLPPAAYAGFALLGMIGVIAARRRQRRAPL